MRRINVTRLAVFCGVAAIHLLLLVFFVVHIESAVFSSEPSAAVMKLTDIQEAPPPPPEEPVVRQSSELVAETMIETEELPPAPDVSYRPPAAENYLPMHRVSTLPAFDEAELLRSRVYPPIAERSGVEGLVYLELFVDTQGRVQRISVLKETPENYGFGEAAEKIFRGKTGSPAQVNGAPVAVRYRYPVRFRLK